MKKPRRTYPRLKTWQSIVLTFGIILLLLAPQIIKGIDRLGHTIVFNRLDTIVIDKRQITTHKEVCLEKLRPGVCENTSVITDTYYLLMTEDGQLFATAEQYNHVTKGKRYSLEVNGWQTPFTTQQVVNVSGIDQ